MSAVNKGDQLQTVLETKIDLGKLNRLYGDFTVKHIQEKVCYQIGHEGVMVMTYKNGNPVKHSPNTRGVYIFYVELICFLICHTFISLKVKS